MIDVHSPIIDFYPASFTLDMNGKKAEWEAIVKIPFIQEDRLLKAIESTDVFNLGRSKRFTVDEIRRNSPGSAFSFQYFKHATPNRYKSALPSVFPDLISCNTQSIIFAPRGKYVPINHLCIGAYVGRELLPGYPSISTVPFSVKLCVHGVNVFNADSKAPSHVVSIKNIYKDETPENTAMLLIGTTVFSSWPFLIESRVISLSDELFTYEKSSSTGQTRIIKTPHSREDLNRFASSCEKSERHYSKRFAVTIGAIDMCARIELQIGMQYLNDGSLAKEFQRVSEYDTPVQLLVVGDRHLDSRFKVLQQFS